MNTEISFEIGGSCETITAACMKLSNLQLLIMPKFQCKIRRI